MAELGSAASVIAVIDLTAKVALLCFQYSKAVKNSKSDIERLLGELKGLITTLEGARHLLEGPNGTRLQTSQGLRDGLRGCSAQLSKLRTKLEEKLNAGAARKAMRNFGIRALKWPFESKDIDGIVGTLERYRDTLSAALTVDQAYVAASSPNFIGLTRSIGGMSLILAKSSFSPSSRLRKMPHSILMPTSMTHDVTPKPGSPSARR